MAQRRIQKRVYTSSTNNKEVYDTKDIQPLTAPVGDPGTATAGGKYDDADNTDDAPSEYQAPHSEPEVSSSAPEPAARPEDTTEAIKTAEEDASSGPSFYSKGDAKESSLLNTGAAGGGAAALGAAGAGGAGEKALSRVKSFMGQRRNQVGVGGLGGVIGLVLFLAIFGGSFEAIYIRENMLGKGNAAVNQALEHRRNHNFYKLINRVNADATVKKINKPRLESKLRAQGFDPHIGADGKVERMSFTADVDGKPVTKTVNIKNNPDLKGAMGEFFDKSEFGRQASRGLDAAVGGKAATWKGSAARKLYGRMGLKFKPNWLNRKPSDKAQTDRAKIADTVRHGQADSGGTSGTRVAGASEDSFKEDTNGDGKIDSTDAPPTVSDTSAGADGAKNADELLNDSNNTGGTVNGVDGSITDVVDQNGGDIAKTASKAGSAALKGLSVLGMQQTACNINGVLKFTANLRNVLVATELARFAFLHYTAADGQKAGIVQSEGLRLYMIYLNTPNPATGKSAVHSGGMQNIVFGNKDARASKVNLAKYSQGRGAPGVLGTASRLVNNALKPVGGVKGCRVVNNGFVQVGALVAGVAIAVGTFGGSAAGEIAAGLPMAIAGQVAIEISTIMAVRAASGILMTGYENGEQVGDALASGHSSSRGMVANSMALRPAKVSTVTALLQDYQASDAIALKNQSVFEKYLSPSNGNSALVKNIAMAASSTNINTASNSLVQGIASTPARLLSAFMPAPRALAASEQSQGEDCDDPYNNTIERNQLQTDQFCGLQFAAAVDVDDETEPILRKNNMIQDKGEVVPGSEFQRYIDYCLSGRTGILYNPDVDKAGNSGSQAEFKLDDGTVLKDPCISDGTPLPSDTKGRFLRYTGWYGYLNDENNFVEYVNDDYSDVSITAPPNQAIGGCSVVDATAPPDMATDPTAKDHVTFKGKTFNKRTVAMLEQADKNLAAMGLPAAQYNQGSYNPGGVANSANTHAKGGAVDVDTSQYGTQAKKLQALKAFRMAGFAAWIRLPGEAGAGSGEHIHGIAIGDSDAHPEALAQVVDYFAGKNGLANGNADRYKTDPGYPLPSWAKAYDKGGVCAV